MRSTHTKTPIKTDNPALQENQLLFFFPRITLYISMQERLMIVFGDLCYSLKLYFVLFSCIGFWLRTFDINGM